MSRTGRLGEQPCGARHAVHGACVLLRAHRWAAKPEEQEHQNAAGARWTYASKCPQKVTTAQLLSALAAHHGNAELAAAALEVTGRLVRRRIADEGLGPAVAAMRPPTLPGPKARARVLATVDRHVTALREALAGLAGCPEQGEARGRVAALLAGSGGA